MDPTQRNAVANEFFAAISAKDLERVAALYDPQVEVWHNVSQRTQTREENLALLEQFTRSLSALRYEVHSRHYFDGGFVQRHTLHGTTHKGGVIAAPVCILVHLADGRIQRIYEYLDANAVAAAFAN